jgi:CubicO group peptidase (beta-lactamase class C family)
MKQWLLSSLVLAAGAVGAAPLPRSTPEAQGVSSAGILAFIEAADKTVDTMNSVMIVRHGKVITEGWWKPYEADTPHSMFSLSKSFTSTAVGLTIAEGKLSLDDPVLKFFPDEAPATPSENLKQMRVRDLLMMSTGHLNADVEKMGAIEAPNAIKAFLEAPVAVKPGTHFLYNSPATFMLSAIVQKVTGQKMVDYLRPRLFDPLGIENPIWQEGAGGISLGATGLELKTEDIARFGLLVLQKGTWEDRQVVPGEWIAAATARQTSTGSAPMSDWDQGYGYQFWRSRHGFRGDGAFGQFCFVLPELDTTIAITSGSDNMQAVMNLVWEHLLPAMKPAALPANESDRKKLSERLAQLEVRRAQGKATPRLDASISGKRYSFEANPIGITALSVDWRTQRERPVMRVTVQGAEQQVTCSKDEWIRSRVNMGPGEQPVAATCAWKTPDTFSTRLVLTGTPFYFDMDVRFEGKTAVLNSRLNVSKPTEEMRLIGTAN